MVFHYVYDGEELLLLLDAAAAAKVKHLLCLLPALLVMVIRCSRTCCTIMMCGGEEVCRTTTTGGGAVRHHWSCAVLRANVSFSSNGGKPCNIPYTSCCWRTRSVSEEDFAFLFSRFHRILLYCNYIVTVIIVTAPSIGHILTTKRNILQFAAKY